MALKGYPTGIWAKQVRMAIDRGGEVYPFVMERTKDRFGQPVNQTWYGVDLTDQVSVYISGIYHEEVRWTPSVVSEEGGTNTNSNKTEAYILCEAEAAAGLEWGMTTYVGKKLYRLVKRRDIEGLNQFCDLVLEEVEPNGL